MTELHKIGKRHGCVCPDLGIHIWFYVTQCHKVAILKAFPPLMIEMIMLHIIMSSHIHLTSTKHREIKEDALDSLPWRYCTSGYTFEKCCFSTFDRVSYEQLLWQIVISKVRASLFNRQNNVGTHCLKHWLLQLCLACGQYVLGDITVQTQIDHKHHNKQPLVGYALQELRHSSSVPMVVSIVTICLS